MITQNNKIVESLVTEKNGVNLSKRKFAAYSVLYLIGITFCITALLLNGGLALASSGDVPSQPTYPVINSVVWAILGVLTLAFIAVSIFFVLINKKRKA